MCPDPTLRRCAVEFSEVLEAARPQSITKPHYIKLPYMFIYSVLTITTMALQACMFAVCVHLGNSGTVILPALKTQSEYFSL